MRMQDGLMMPALGFGTYGRKGAAGVIAIGQAIEAGYRHLDTAQDYNTEAEVGQAVRQSGLDRAEVFVVTKVATGNLAADRVVASLGESLRQLKMDYVDLALIHWPAPNGAIAPEVYLPELKKAQEAGLCRHIGVSNFTIALLEQAEGILGPGAITCNQVELNPLFKNAKLAGYCRSKGIRITCYQPIAKGRLSGNEVLRQIADAHGVTGEQVGLAWEWAKGYSAIPTSSRLDRIVDGYKALCVALTSVEIAQIDTLADGPRQIGPDWGPKWD
jgi:2,5-diketo-D-gluconate reductase B